MSSNINYNKKNTDYSLFVRRFLAVFGRVGAYSFHRSLFEDLTPEVVYFE